MYNKIIKYLAQCVNEVVICPIGKNVESYGSFWLGKDPWSILDHIGDDVINANVTGYDLVSKYGTKEVYLEIRTKWTEAELDKIIPEELVII